jgi:hypothetical protein
VAALTSRRALAAARVTFLLDTAYLVEVRRDDEGDASVPISARAIPPMKVIAK